MTSCEKHNHTFLWICDPCHNCVGASSRDVRVHLVASQSASMTSIAAVSFSISPFFILASLTASHTFCFFAVFHTCFLPPVIFKEVNTCNPATITGTLSRISLDDDEDPKLHAHQEGGVNFSPLPGNIPPPNLIVQVKNLQK